MSTLPLQWLYRTTPVAKQMASKDKAILVFPNIIKNGLIIGGQYGQQGLMAGLGIQGSKITAFQQNR